MTTFYTAKPLRANALSAAVGSGKTRAAIKWIADPVNASRNFIYVAPTIELGTQTAGNLQAALAEAGGVATRNVHLVNSRNVEGKTRVAALKSINEVAGHEGQIEVLTTTTLLSILAGITKPELWAVILDEAFDPAAFDTFPLGSNVQAGFAYFCEVFEVDPLDGYRVNPRAGKKAAVADIADGRFSVVGGKYAGLQEIAAAVANPARRCELLATDRVKALVSGEPLPMPKLKKGMADGSTESVLEYSSYIAPEYFSGFESVLFLSALFEQTVIYHLWTKALGVTFVPHPDFPTDLLRDTHKEQGRFLAVGHLLHQSDTSSIENLSRNILTGLPGEKVEGQRVLDHVIRTASAHFNEQKFLLQTNANKGYGDGNSLTPSNAICIPAYAHGLDKYQHTDNVVALAVTNPTPQRRLWLMERTGMTAAEVGVSMRVHSVYQALGRCSIRNFNQTSAPKTILVAGLADAQFLSGLFPGSHWLGKIGDLPPLRALAAKTSKENSPERKATKSEVLAEAIRDYLATLKDTDKVSSMALREAVKTHMEHLYLKVPDVGFPSCPEMWRRSLAKACTPGTGWRKQGSSLVRMTGEVYGFSNQSQAL